MIIIIEGIDRVGKTTLVNMLKEEFNIPVFKQERLGGNEDVNKFTEVNFGRALGLVETWNFEGFDNNVIMDRFHWTEAVYSLCNRGLTKPMEYMKVVEDEMVKHKDKYLVVLVDPVDISFSIRNHGSDLTRHQEEFEKLYDESLLPKCRTKFGDYWRVFEEIKRRINNERK